jgi:succinyl-CoA synthetase alpha subunit
MPSGGISETSVNAVLAFIGAAEPKNEIEAALAIQMACTHAVAMAVLSRAGGAYGGDRHVALMASAGARLLKAFATQVEAMRRLRNGGTQVRLVLFLPSVGSRQGRLVGGLRDGLWGTSGRAQEEAAGGS